MVDQPPEIVPDGLSAEEYYNLGTWYHQSNQYTQARDALNRVITLEPESSFAIEAKKFIGTNIPKNDLPIESVTKFHKLGWQTIGAPDRALLEYQKLIDKHPDFEWPFKGAADIHLRNGNLSAAIEMLEKALKINPDYAPAMLTMAFAKAADMDYPQAKEYVQKALGAYPTTPEEEGDALMQSERAQLRALRRSIELLTALDY